MDNYLILLLFIAIFVTLYYYRDKIFGIELEHSKKNKEKIHKSKDKKKEDVIDLSDDIFLEESASDESFGTKSNISYNSMNSTGSNSIGFNSLFSAGSNVSNADSEFTADSANSNNSTATDNISNITGISQLSEGSIMTNGSNDSASSFESSLNGS